MVSSVPGRRAPIPNLPIPRPDELLYSLIARSAVHVGFWDAKPFLRSLYAGVTKPACPDLPGALLRLGSATAGVWGRDPREMALQHTLLPYYTRFLAGAAREAALRQLLEGSGHLHMTLGINASGVRPVPSFRLCETCSREDVRQYGETYWRRAHHLPGVFVCPTHGEPLMETRVPFRPVRRYGHVPAHPELLQCARPFELDVKDLDPLQQIAKRSEQILAGEPGPGAPDYRSVLAAHGFVRKHGAPARFREAVDRQFSKRLLTQMFTELGADGYPHWVDAVRRKPRTEMHPLKHVLVQLVIESLSVRVSVTRLIGRPDLRGKSREPTLRAHARKLAKDGLSTRAIALRLGCAWKTAQRLLQPIAPPRHDPVSNRPASADRRAWEKLRSDHSLATRTALRRMAKALYARLYRDDRAWLLAQPCAAPVRTVACRIDWAERDAELAREVADEADRLEALVPPVRITKTRLLGALRVDSTFHRHRDKLLRTAEVIAARTECVEAFQLRRLKSVLVEECDDIPDWFLLRRARINPQRIPDKGASLISTARRVAQCL